MKTRIIILFTLISFALNGQNISVDSLKFHIYYLASDKLKGRAPGEKGEKLAYQYIMKQMESFIPKSGGRLKKPVLQPFTYKESANPHDTVKGITRNGKNVITYLDNGAPYTIIIGAHYDHLGMGNHYGSLDANPKGKIHNGADDNASGTAGVLELARYYSTNDITEPCNFLFINFSAEESGLIGSKFFTNNPTIDLSKVQCMINMDMIGRLSDSTHVLMVHGVGTSPSFVNIVNSVPHEGLNIKPDSSGIGPSDFTSFYLKNIPVLGFFTGSHSDYHKPSDDAEKIHYEEERVVLLYIADIINTLSAMHKLPFTQTRNESSERVSFKVTLGIMPDYAYDGVGIRVDGVSENKPAAKAGIKAGDIIIKLGDHDTRNMQEYMKALGAFNKGDSTTVVVKRGTQELNLPIVL
jgi:hypothetical protein